MELVSLCWQSVYPAFT